MRVSWRLDSFSRQTIHVRTGRCLRGRWLFIIIMPITVAVVFATAFYHYSSKFLIQNQMSAFITLSFFAMVFDLAHNFGIFIRCKRFIFIWLFLFYVITPIPINS